jgi:hypothetical protein
VFGHSLYFFSMITVMIGSSNVCFGIDSFIGLITPKEIPN